MNQPKQYRLVTVIKMTLVVVVFLLLFNSVDIIKWIYRMPVESGLRDFLIQVYEPVYAVCSKVPYTNLTASTREKYRNFAEIEYRATMDYDPASLLSVKKYPWLTPSDKKEINLAAKIDSLSVNPAPDSVTIDESTVLQVLLIGDSMLKVGFGDNLQKALKEISNVDVTYFGKSATGLVRQDYFDWFQQLDKLCKGKKFHLIVIMIGANDAQGIRQDGKDIQYGSEPWIDLYRSKVNLFARMISNYSQKFYWIGMPPMLSKGFDGRMRTLSKIFEEETGKMPNGKFISAINVLGDNKGNYTAYIKSGGKQLLVRANDGIHLTNSGGELLTQAVIEKFKVDFKR